MHMAESNTQGYDNDMNGENLRRSCESCSGAKLRCSQERPKCDRCKRNGMSCIYQPVKRLGRPRRRIDEGNCGRSLGPDAGQRVLRALVSAATLKGTEADVDETPPSSHYTSPQTSDTSLEDIQSNESMFGPNTVDWDPCIDGSYLPDIQTVACSNLSTNIPIQLEHVDDTTLKNHALNPGISTLDKENILSKMHDISRSHPGPAPWPSGVLNPTTDANTNILNKDPSQRGCTAAIQPLGSGSNPVEAQSPCVCYPALMALLFHRKSIRNSQSGIGLVAYQRVEHLLQWTMATHMDCGSCRDDELVTLIWARVSNELLEMYGSVVDQYTDNRGYDNM